MTSEFEIKYQNIKCDLPGTLRTNFNILITDKGDIIFEMIKSLVAINTKILNFF